MEIQARPTPLVRRWKYVRIKYWVYNHFDRESSGYIIPFEYLTLEEESTKDDLVTLYERLGFKEEAPSSDVRYSM